MAPSGLELGAVRLDPFQLGGDRLPPGSQEPDQLRPVPGPAEHEGHAERIGPVMEVSDRVLAQDPQLAESLVGDPIDRPGGPHGRPARCATGSTSCLPLHLAELPVEGTHAYTAPVADVRLLGVPPDLVTVTRAVGQESDDYRIRSIATASRVQQSSRTARTLSRIPGVSAHSW